MSRSIFSFEDPIRFIVGTIGLPGEREFFLQVKDASNVRSFSLEKSQASALGERCSEILREIGANRRAEVVDLNPLETPVESEFPIGVMSLLWNAEDSRFFLEAQSALGVDGNQLAEEIVQGDDDDAPSLLRVKFTIEMAAAFSRRTADVVAAGRQPCMFCGGPVDLSGHLCPRANGYRRRE